MSFNYFANPRAFAYLADEGLACHFCKATQDCLDGCNLFGQENIEAVCFDCMAAGKLIDLDISTNQIDEAALDPGNDLEGVANEITYCTPSVPTWQDCFWPVKNGKPYRFIKIASKLDYDSKEQFVATLFCCDQDPELWEMLPDLKIENMEVGQYDISFYLFEDSGDKLTIWDAN
ncbi:CbrC family protein [Persicirhabdus sediminis]|uniref:CbrC family protein n=1 Tax=Persicirhabdus sediminis TaxID=454144 RepID=A0A8J7MC40_9BACT|nr:CbrC family protein [Persicirhabdus sediminis]MBK1789766.1 CbrC family protein [Persicirhabdus sediminis]